MIEGPIVVVLSDVLALMNDVPACAIAPVRVAPAVAVWKDSLAKGQVWTAGRGSGVKSEFTRSAKRTQISRTG